jgi:hypothetical protein
MFLLVWGDSGCGKTTLAATAPGEKAFIQFDPQGVASIAHRTDCHVLDLSGYSANSCMLEFNTIDPFGMKKWIKERPNVGTVVVDSVTALAFLALQYAVTKAGGNSNVDVPGMHGYGVRNNVMRRVVVSIMQMCAELDKHLIVVTHEGAPDKDTQGNITSITMALSTNLANDVSLRFNEVWWMKDSGEARTLYVRPWGHYKPMKSRMFMSTDTTRSFVWKYDADALTGDGIAQWFEAWQSNGGRKIPLPNGGKK